MDELLEMAQELDGMDKSVNSWEAQLLEDTLIKLRAGQTLTPGQKGQEAKLREIYDRYLGEDCESTDDSDADTFM